MHECLHAVCGDVTKANYGVLFGLPYGVPSSVPSSAEEAFLASSVREVLPIAAVDDIALPHAPGPVTSAAHETFRRRVARELAAPAAA